MAQKLLIADDSSTIQKVFERTFPSSEFQLIFATNGAEALEKAREEKPDLIIADINMPEKNGIEVCEEVKRDPELRDIPVLLLVGVLDEFDEKDGERVGAAGYMIKPFEATAAISKVKEVLAQASKPFEERVEEPLPAAREEEEIIELTEVVEEAKEEKVEVPPEEKEFVLESPLKDLEKELEATLEVEEKEVVEEKKGEEPLKLDISLEELELGEEVRAEAPSEEAAPEVKVEEKLPEEKEEKLEAILGESAEELERIETPEEKPAEEEFVKAFEREFAAPEIETTPTFTPSEVSEKVLPEEAPRKEAPPAEEVPAASRLEGAVRELISAMAEEIASAVTRQLKETIEESVQKALKEVSEK